MNRSDAIDLINNRLTYKEGWGWDVWEDYDNHHEIHVHVEYEAVNSSPRETDPRPIVIAERTFTITSIGDELDIERQMLRGFIECETHEAREFMRVNGHAPFHPHTFSGIAAFEGTFGDRGVQVFGY